MRSARSGLVVTSLLVTACAAAPPREVSGGQPRDEGPPAASAAGEPGADHAHHHAHGEGHAHHGEHHAHGASHQHGQADGGHAGAMHHRFENGEEWAKVFDAPERDAWQQPEQVLDALGLTPTSVTADVGAGTGYFSVRLARRSPRGRVYAVDIEPDMVRYLGERARREGLSNVQPVLGAADDARLPEAVDVALIVDTLHHIEGRVAYLTKLRERLREAGRIAVVDFLPEATLGPPKEHRLPAQDVIAAAEQAGLKLTRSFTLTQQYVLIFERAAKR